MPGEGSRALSKLDSLGGVSRYDRKHERVTAEKAHERIVHQAVDVRDHHTCRVCDHYCSPLAVGLLERSHRHHLVYKSAGGPTETWNLVTLCASCHNGEHQKRMQLSGDADARDLVTGRLNGVCVETLTESGWKVDRFC
jgi:5-methylcytosine-specific restriction endonuclease McrA